MVDFGGFTGMMRIERVGFSGEVDPEDLLHFLATAPGCTQRGADLFEGAWPLETGENLPSNSTFDTLIGHGGWPKGAKEREGGLERGHAGLRIG